MPLQSGQTLQNRYRILRPLGKGGMGSVYLAEDGRLGNKHVAIKEFDPAVLPPQDRQWAANAFAQEAQMLARLSHPALTAVTDYFAEHNLFYLVMEYVPGETLENAWQRQPGHRFTPEQVSNWARQLCEVLHYLHSQNPPVIFRDLKPANIMVLPNGRLKLIDFGIARYFAPGKTRDTIALGTPGYAAPEQHGQSQADARSDIYALGAVLHQLLTGYDPAMTPFHLPPVRSLAPSVPQHQAQAVDKALALDRERRPASARAFYREFQPGNKPAPAIPNWLWGIMGLLLLLLVGGFIGFRWLRDQPAPPIIAANAPANAPASAPTVSPDETPIPASPSLLPEEGSVITRTLFVTVTVPVTEAAIDTVQPADVPPTFTPEPPMIMCTPPACGPAEVFFCPGDCPGGCGTICATVTPLPPSNILNLISEARISVSAEADQAIDTCGNPVTYFASNLIDGQNDTAWRVQGDGRGAAIYVNFNRPVTLTKFSILPGYDKRDPCNQTIYWCPMNRIPQRVRISGSAGQQVELDLVNDCFWQEFLMDSWETTTLTIQILTSYPRRSEHRIDYTTISEIRLFGY